MRDTKKYAAQKMGFSKSSIPGTVVPDGVVEATCPLCGHFQPLDSRGYCNTSECNLAARQLGRKLAREACGSNGVSVPSLYYKFGDLEVINFTKLERWEDPKQIKHPDMCSSGECISWALPADYLCRHHRLEENRQEYLQSLRDKQKPRKIQKARKAHKQHRLPGNKIRGLGGIKVK